LAREGQQFPKVYNNISNQCKRPFKKDIQAAPPST